MRKKKHNEFIDLDTYYKIENLEKDYFISSNKLNY